MSYSNNISRGGRTYTRVDSELLTAYLTLAGNSGSNVKVALAVLNQNNLQKGKGPVKLTGYLCRKFGVADNKSKANGLDYWAALGLWAVAKEVGKNPAVQITAKPGNITQTARLFRVQVSELTASPVEDCLVTFNDGSEARVGALKVRRRVRQIFDSAEMCDVILVDRGTGWIVETIYGPSDEWHRPEFVKMHTTTHSSATAIYADGQETFARG